MKDLENKGKAEKKKPPEKKPSLQGIAEAWLSQFKGEATRKAYSAILRQFQNFIKKKHGLSLDDYVKQQNDFEGDLASFIISHGDKTPKTLRLYGAVVKEFLQEHVKGLDLSNAWKRIKDRQQIVSVALTQDKAPTKAELRKILNYMDVKGRALTLFLASTGCRVGEALKLHVQDLNLDADPPKAIIRPTITKGKVGGRVVRMSYEARDAIKDWLQVKDKLKKKTGVHYDAELVFPFTERTANLMFNNALRKAGLDQRDPDTGRRILHIHALRKFFRTYIGLDFDLTNALMGHSAYLDKSYRRLREEDIDRAYLSAMKNISIYTAEKSRLEDVKSKLAMVGLTFEDIRAIISEEEHKAGEGSGGGLSHKPIDESFIASLEDEEIGRYALKALRRKLFGSNGGPKPKPIQKIVDEGSLENHLSHGWRFVAALNNGKCIVERLSGED